MVPDLDSMTMDVIMRRWPVTAEVILHRRMLCVGCPIARFHTLSDAAREHRIDEASLRQEIEIAIAAGAATTPSPGDLRQA